MPRGHAPALPSRSLFTPAIGALLAGALAVLLAAGCAAPHAGTARSGATPAVQPYVLVLGSAQDGGLPQIGCARECCRAARADPARGRLVVSLLLVDPRDGRRWLFEATPDIAEQVELARGHGAPRGGVPPGDGRGRPALFDGIFLTHAHTGHYTGLAHLGREAYGGAGVPLFVSARMAAYLASNGPWSLIVEDGHVRPVVFAAGERIELAPDLAVTPLRVPHREEFTDAFAFVIEGPRARLLFLPDIDKWERWERSIEEVLAGVDVALVDGTFFDAGELPGRDMSAIPHPFIVESLARFAPLPEHERAKVHFVHLNHSNPAADPASSAARRVRDAGSRVAADGDVHEL